MYCCVKCNNVFPFNSNRCKNCRVQTEMEPVLQQRQIPINNNLSNFNNLNRIKKEMMTKKIVS